MLLPWEVTQAFPCESRARPLSASPRKCRNCCCSAPLTSAYFATLRGYWPSMPPPLLTHAVPSAASTRPNGWPGILLKKYGLIRIAAEKNVNAVGSIAADPDVALGVSRHSLYSDRAALVAIASRERYA